MAKYTKDEIEQARKRLLGTATPVELRIRVIQQCTRIAEILRVGSDEIMFDSHGVTLTPDQMDKLIALAGALDALDVVAIKAMLANEMLLSLLSE